MLMFRYYLADFFFSFFYKRNYYLGKKEFYERQVNFSFLDLIFTPEGNKKTDEADIHIQFDETFRLFNIEMGSPKRRVLKKFGRPNYVHNVKTEHGLKINAVFYKTELIDDSCLLQFYFIDNELYCIDMKFAGKVPADKNIIISRLNGIFKDILPADSLQQNVALVLENSVSDILARRFYVNVENYFNFKIRIIPYFGKYRSMTNPGKPLIKKKF